MDRRFMEFWGNLFINAAKSQKQVEDMTSCFQQNMTTFEEMTSAFKKIYGFDMGALPCPDGFKSCNKAVDDFQQLFINGCLSLMGIKPLPDGHLDLIKKYEELKERVTSQEETIKHLRLLLEESKNAKQAQATLQLEGVMQKQADQFQSMMNNLGQVAKPDSPQDESHNQ